MPRGRTLFHPDPAFLFWSFACDKLFHVAWHSWLLLLAMGKSPVWPSKSLWPRAFFSLSLSCIWNWVTWPKCTAKLALSVGFGLFAARQVCLCVCRPGKYKFDIIFQRQLQAASYIEWKCSPICLGPEMHWHLGAWPRRSDFCGFNFAEWRMKFPLLFCAFLWLFFTIPQSFWGWKKLEKNIKLKFHVLYWLDLIWVKQVKGIWFLLHFKLLTWLGKFHLLGTILYFFQYCKYYIY